MKMPPDGAQRRHAPQPPDDDTLDADVVRLAHAWDARLVTTAGPVRHAAIITASAQVVPGTTPDTTVSTTTDTTSPSSLVVQP